MDIRRVAVLGGGPGGLYAARLLKLAHPSCEVEVFEQSSPDRTFGFGIGLAARTQRNLRAADPDSLDELVSIGRPYDMSMAVGGDTVVVRTNNAVGVARTELLAVLHRYAEKARVRLHFDSRTTVDDLDADLVIAADGVASATREQGDFGSSVRYGRGLYLWCGTDFALLNSLFAPVTTEHGTFVTHAYPYAPDRSTFLVETDDASWRAAGFDATTAATPPGESDSTSLAYLQDAFADQLQGHRLIGNRTQWTRFRSVRCDRWSSGRTVLLGDAAHTAHYSIGSGTKLAMEDAIALVEALGAAGDLPGALSNYEHVRRPQVERLQALARRSQLWWESFATRLDLPVEQLMVAFMTRAGNVPLERFQASSPEVVERAVSQYAGAPTSTADLVETVLSEPLDRAGEWYPSRVVGAEPAASEGMATVADVVDDPWGDAGDRVVDEAVRARVNGARGFRIVGPGDRQSLLTRLELAERLRREVGGVVVVHGPEEFRDDLAAGLVSGRTDLVAFEGVPG